jgi:urea transport system permease protein
LGAIVVNFAKTYFTGALPEYWLFALGGLFVLVTLFLPRGILGLALTRTQSRKPAIPETLAGEPPAAAPAREAQS